MPWLDASSLKRTIIRMSSAFQSKRILFFLPGSSVCENAIMASQVLGLAKWLVKQGAKCLIMDKGMAGAMQPGAPVPNKDGVDIFDDCLPRKRCHLPFVSRMFATIANEHIDIFRRFQPTHIYVRDYLSCLAIKNLARKFNAKLVYSVRGADVEELLLNAGLKQRIQSLYVRVALRKAIRACDHLNCVSNRLAELLFDRYHRNASVLPCCAGLDENDLNGVLKDHSERTIVYAGGLYSWQNFNEILQLMKGVKACDPGIKVKILTRDQNGLRKKCRAIGFPEEQWEGRSCRSEEVHRELEESDVGVILRNDIIVNNVASPIKLGEYLAAGLGIVVSPCIGDVGVLLQRAEFAKFYMPGDSMSDVASFVRGMSTRKRLAARKFAIDHYTYSSNRAVLEQMFA